MKKLFISQPMQGKSKEEILAERKSAICQAKEAVGDEVEIIDSYFEKRPGVQPAALVPGRKPKAARNSGYCIFCNRLGRRTRMQDRAHLRRGIRRPHH